jgi:hypothetical protein
MVRFSRHRCVSLGLGAQPAAEGGDLRSLGGRFRADHVIREWRRRGDREGRHQATGREVRGGNSAQRQGDAAPGRGSIQDQARIVEARASRRIDILEAGRAQPHRPVRVGAIARRRVVVQKRVMPEVLRRPQGASPLEQRRRADGDHRVGKEQLGEKAGIAPPAVADRHVHILAHEVDEPHGRRDPHVDLGVQLLKPLEPRDQPFRRQCGRGADRQRPAALPLAEPREGDRHAVEGIAQACHAGLPGLGQEHRPVEPAEEFYAQMVLERFDLVADRSRRDVQLLGSPGEAQVARGSLEGAQAVQGRQAPGHGTVLT